jgi:hypothetical protein
MPDLLTTLKEGRQIKQGWNETNSGTFGTAAADSDTYVAPAMEAMVIDRGLTGHTIPGTYGTRNQTHGDTITNTKGAMAKFNVNCPFNYLDSDQLFYGWFQKVAEAVGSPYIKTFTPFTTHPQFDSDAGHYMTFVKAYPAAGTSWKSNSSICSRLKVSIDRDAHDALLWVESDWISLDEGVVTSTAYADATFSRTATTGIKYFNDVSRFLIDFNDSLSPTADIAILQGLSFEMTHDVQGLSPDGSGGWGTIGMSNRQMNFEIRTLKDANFESMLTNQSTDGDIRILLNFGTAGTPTATGDVEFDVYGKINPDGIAVDEESLLGATITGTISQETDQATEPITITMGNDVDRTW